MITPELWALCCVLSVNDTSKEAGLVRQEGPGSSPWVRER